MRTFSLTELRLISPDHERLRVYYNTVPSISIYANGCLRRNCVWNRRRQLIQVTCEDKMREIQQS